MPTTVQVAEKTLQMLNELKKEIGASSHDEVIRMLISERKKIPPSMFGSNPNLRPFSREDKAELSQMSAESCLEKLRLEMKLKRGG